MSESSTIAAGALAEGDFRALGSTFAAAGLSIAEPIPGALQICGKPGRSRLLLSAGVHGDETAPIELLAQVMGHLAGAPEQLAVDLMLVVGNPAAIRKGTRYVDADLNRMFGTTRGDLAAAGEAQRADAIMRTVEPFLAGAAGSLHLDLHSAIRPSLFPMFAVVPCAPSAFLQGPLPRWMEAAGLGAVVCNDAPSSTFSAWTRAAAAAHSATLELGRVARLGTNDLASLASVRAALDALLRDGTATPQSSPRLFRVLRELTKHSDAFHFCIDPDAPNFTMFAPGVELAVDGRHRYRVGPRPEWLLFPNPDVRPGLRAGLMLASVG